MAERPVVDVARLLELRANPLGAAEALVAAMYDALPDLIVAYQQLVSLDAEVAILRNALAREAEFVRRLQIERLELQARLDEYIATTAQK